MSRTDAELTQDYTAMGHSKDLINDVVAGNLDSEYDSADRQDIVDRNVDHLELMVAKDDWRDSDDMTDINAAITSGNSYTA